MSSVRDRGTCRYQSPAAGRPLPCPPASRPSCMRSVSTISDQPVSSNHYHSNSVRSSPSPSSSALSPLGCSISSSCDTSTVFSSSTMHSAPVLHVADRPDAGVSARTPVSASMLGNYFQTFPETSGSINKHWGTFPDDEIEAFLSTKDMSAGGRHHAPLPDLSAALSSNVLSFFSPPGSASLDDERSPANISSKSSLPSSKAVEKPFLATDGVNMFEYSLKEEIPRDIKAYLKHPFNGGAGDGGNGPASSDALALFHEFQNLPSLDHTGLKSNAGKEDSEDGLPFMCGIKVEDSHHELKAENQRDGTTGLDKFLGCMDDLDLPSSSEDSTADIFGNSLADVVSSIESECDGSSERSFFDVIESLSTTPCPPDQSCHSSPHELTAHSPLEDSADKTITNAAAILSSTSSSPSLMESPSAADVKAAVAALPAIQIELVTDSSVLPVATSSSSSSTTPALAAKVSSGGAGRTAKAPSGEAVSVAPPSASLKQPATVAQAVNRASCPSAPTAHCHPQVQLPQHIPSFGGKIPPGNWVHHPGHPGPMPLHPAGAHQMFHPHSIGMPAAGQMGHHPNGAYCPLPLASMEGGKYRHGNAMPHPGILASFQGGPPREYYMVPHGMYPGYHPQATGFLGAPTGPPLVDGHCIAVPASPVGPAGLHSPYHGVTSGAPRPSATPSPFTPNGPQPPPPFQSSVVQPTAVSVLPGHSQNPTASTVGVSAAAGTAGPLSCAQPHGVSTLSFSHCQNLKSPDSGYGDTGPGVLHDADGTRSRSDSPGSSCDFNKKKRSLSHLVTRQISTGCKGAASHPLFFPKRENDPTGFQHTLEAVISSGTRVEEDRMTYLNKDQFYPIILENNLRKKNGSNAVLKTVLSLVFREDKNTDVERKNWEFWYSRRESDPTQHVLEMDEKNSEGILPGSTEACALNAVSVQWSPCDTQKTKVMLAVHCLSTDFSNQKGVKGLPLHIQVDTYDDPAAPLPFHRGYCQIKIFCDKGAERKARDEERKREKLVKPDVHVKSKRPCSEAVYHCPTDTNMFYSMADLQSLPILYNHSPSTPGGILNDLTADGIERVLGKDSFCDADLMPPAKRPRTGECGRVLLYVREEHEAVYTALMLQHASLSGLVKAICEKYSFIPSIRMIYKRTEKGILVKMDDNIVQHYAHESTFLIELTKAGPSNHYDVTLVEIRQS